MPAAYTRLELYDGTTTLNLVDGVNYNLVDNGYRPGVPRRRKGKMGSRSTYQEVSEEIRVNVYGTTGAIALDNLNNLAEFLDAAERWSEGARITQPIRLLVLPQGSDFTVPLQAIVRGSSSEGLLNLSPSFNDKLMVWVIPDVGIPIVRDGLWLGATQTVPSPVVDNPGIATASTAFTIDTPVASPLEFNIIFDAAPYLALYKGFILVTTATNRSYLREAEDFTLTETGAGTFLDVAATRASGGTVAELVPLHVGEYSMASGDISASIDANAVKYTVLASVKNFSTTISYAVSFEIRPSGNPTSRRSRKVTIGTTTQNPQVISLGTLPSGASIGVPPYHLNVFITPSAIGTSADKLQIDYLVMQAVGNDSDAIIAFDKVPNVDIWIYSGVVYAYYVRPLMLYAPTSGQKVPATYDGNTFLENTGTALCMRVIGTTGTEWLLQGSLLNTTGFGFSAIRRTAYLVPQ